MSRNTRGPSRRDALGLAVGAAALIPSVGWAADGPVVETAHGKVRGFTNNGVHTFRGVRYGAPTGGPNRFMPPKRPEHWGGVVDATQYGYSAPQTNPSIPVTGGPTPVSEMQSLFTASNGWRGDPAESEDCLFLNIWTQGLSADRLRPVVVWLHGGGFSSGSSSILLYDGANMVSRGDVVFVGVNHRLNTFGYTNFSEIGGADYARSGVVGMMDVVHALEWVRDNIAAFGGDPRRVMIFGESGGGAKVSFLLGCPTAKGLFHRAVIESGPGLRETEQPAATAAAEALLEELSLDRASLADIHSLPTRQVLDAYFKAQARVASGGLGGGGFTPSLDPVVMPSHPFDPVASPEGEDVPVIVGWNRTEATLFQMSDTAAFELDEAGLEQRIGQQFPGHAEALLAAYKAAQPDGSPSDVYFAIATDQLMGLNSVRLAERKAAQGGAPVWVYRFDWGTPVLGGKLRSPHGIEMPFVFDNIDEAGTGTTGGAPELHDLAAQMCGAWISFAERGDPNAPGAELPHWPAFDAEARQTMVFDRPSHAGPEPAREARALLAEAMGA